MHANMEHLNCTPYHYFKNQLDITFSRKPA